MKTLFILILALLSGESFSKELNIKEHWEQMAYAKIYRMQKQLNAPQEVDNNVFKTKQSLASRGITIEVLAKEFEKRRIDVLAYDSDGELFAHVQHRVEEDKDKKWRIRFLSGYYTDSSLAEILFENSGGKHNSGTNVAGVELGKVVYRNFNGWPMDILIQLGFAKHDEKAFQTDAYSMTAGIKIEWKNFPWNHIVRTKIDLTEGLNYSSRVPYFESEHVKQQNDGRDSKLMNYLGVGIGFNLGDILNAQSLNNCYVGGYIYHRSGVFATVDAFNNVKGGSNFKTAYLECSY